MQIVLAVKPKSGVDMFFMNRPSPLDKITSIPQLATYFSTPPQSPGSTPMLGSLRSIYKSPQVTKSSKYLLINVTDGELTDGSSEDKSVEQLKLLLFNKPSQMYVSMVECSDCKEEMDFLEGWNGIIPNFDNTESLAEETVRIRQIQQSPTFKFTYTDYVIKILLATFYSKYFSLDMYKNYSGSTYSSVASPVTITSTATSTSVGYNTTPVIPPTSTNYNTPVYMPTTRQPPPPTGCSCIIL